MEVRHTAHQAVLTAALRTMTTISTTSTAVPRHMLTNMEVDNSILLLLVVIKLVTVARRVTTRPSRAGSKPLIPRLARLCAAHRKGTHGLRYIACRTVECGMEILRWEGRTMFSRLTIASG
jgi:hypothetical protein